MMPNNSLHKRPGPKLKLFQACAVDGCGKRAWKCHRYCPKHHLRNVRHGDPTMVKARGRKTKNGDATKRTSDA